MNWNSVVGQDRVKAILKRSFTTGKIPHAYLFYGPEGSGKDAAALVFAALLHCENPSDANPCEVCTHCKRISALQHPNLKLIVPLPVGKNEKEGDDPYKQLDEKTMEEYRHAIRQKSANPYYKINISRATTIKINSIRDIRKSIALARAEQGMKVVIISQADKMNDSAANSLLKTLEEPSANTVIILTTSRHDALLPTIVSRCQSVRFELLRDDEIRTALCRQNERLDERQAALISKLANGSFSRALELTETDLIRQREEIIDLLRSIVARSPASWIKHMETFAGAGDRDYAARSLILLNLWIRDALLLQNRNDDDIINLDQHESLRKFVNHFPDAKLTEVVKAVERAIALVEKNIYLSLALINLAFEIRRHVVGH